jgi:hypothetical protein
MSVFHIHGSDKMNAPFALEIANSLPDDLDSPDWEEKEYHSWKHCIPRTLREGWGVLNFESKIIAYIVAEKCRNDTSWLIE